MISMMKWKFWVSHYLTRFELVDDDSDKYLNQKI